MAAQPEEWTFHIEPDGRIVMDGVDLDNASLRRLIEHLEETVGPVREVAAQEGDPPRRFITPDRHHTEDEHQEIKH